MNKIISIIVCILTMLNALFVVKDILNANVYAEENIEETTEFETLEKQILNSERWCNSIDDGTKISLDIDSMRFLPNEDIVVSYLVSNEQEITNFDYEATGFEVVNIGIDEENSSRI